MTGMIGKITKEPWVEKSKFGDSDVLYVQVSFALPDDVRTVEYLPGDGEDTWPMVGDMVTVYTIGGVLVATGGKDALPPALKTGEREFYSRDADGNKIARVTLLNTGEIDIESLPDGEPVSRVTLMPDGKITAVSIHGGEDAAQIKLLDTGEIDIESIKGEAKITVKDDGEIVLSNKNGTVTYTASGEMTIDGKQKVTIKAPDVELSGNTSIVVKTAGSAAWCPNGVSGCYMTGAPHGGPAMGIIGLKGS
jgi:hypothetical protein